jgi:branched-chain amino acid transport system ATP-binding protein
MVKHPPLQLSDIHLAFGGLRVLNGVSFSLQPAELLAVVGPNGAGKTSVLNCISGLYRPTSGNILFNGGDVSAWPPHRRAAAGIARTFQHVELFRHLTVLDNLLVGRHAHTSGRIIREAWYSPSTRRQEVAQRRRAEEVLDFVELQHFRKQVAGDLPYGTQKLVGFARALAMDPHVLLLDEPSAGLARGEKEDLSRFILRAKHQLHLPMLWVEHDMQMVADLADRLLVLHHGEPIAEGVPDQVLADARVIEVYLGRPVVGSPRTK